MNKNRTRMNAILILLDEEQMKWCDKNDIEQYIKSRTSINLDTRSGANGKGHTKLGRKLFLYPIEEADLVNILKFNDWIFAKNEKISLENKNSYIILRAISFNEVEESSQIRQELTDLNIKCWTPLIDNEKDHLAIKCEIITRADLSEVLLKYFVDGKKFNLINNKIANVRFDPDIKNPVQCFVCYKFDGHMAESCQVSNAKCENCGDQRHTNDDEQHLCNKKTHCLNCNGNHGARNKICEEYIKQKVLKLQDKAHLLTGKFMIRPPKGRKALFSSMVKKHTEGVLVPNDYDNWKQSAESRVINIERRHEAEKEKI